MYEDKELQEYRDLLKTPDHFEEGFDWKTVVGAIFIGFLMMPGSMYLQLVIGTGIGPAARWVTIILFAEIAKRAHSELKQQEIFILYYMAGAALASPFQGLLWNQYLVQSDAARMLGLTEFIPAWIAPSMDSDSLVERTLRWTSCSNRARPWCCASSGAAPWLAPPSARSSCSTRPASSRRSS